MQTTWKPALALGVQPARIDTIANFSGPQAERYGVKTDGGAVGGTAEILGRLAQLVADGRLEVQIAHTYPLEQVRDAYRELEKGHLLGKIVLMP